MSDHARDVVADLQHDLVKYLRLPLLFLPKDAPDADVRAAVLQGIHQTRGTRGARQIFEALAAEAPTELVDSPGWRPFVDAVERALAWAGPAADETRALDRSRVEADHDALRLALAELAAGLG